MPLSNHLSTSDVILDLAASNKKTLLHLLAERAAERLGRPEEEILKALLGREALGSTALGRGVALPHARLAGDDPPMVLFVRLERPIDYEARDDEAVDLVILVLWPDAEADGFLPALAEACRALREPQALHRLRAATSADEVIAELSRGDQAEPRGEGT